MLVSLLCHSKIGNIKETKTLKISPCITKVIIIYSVNEAIIIFHLCQEIFYIKKYNKGQQDSFLQEA